ncbi:MAG: hypothetical protein AAF629_05570 [Chloroflexota bacterium]
MMTTHIPRWIIGYAILQLVLALLFGLMAYFNRGFQFPELVGNADALFPIGLFANRNLGVSVALIAGLVLRNRWMLLTVFVIRFATDVFDFFLGLANGGGGIGALVGMAVFFGLVLWIPEILAIRSLWKAETKTAS